MGQPIARGPRRCRRGLGKPARQLGEVGVVVRRVPASQHVVRDRVVSRVREGPERDLRLGSQVRGEPRPQAGRRVEGVGRGDAVPHVPEHHPAGGTGVPLELDQHVLRIRRLVPQAVAREELGLATPHRRGEVARPEGLERLAVALRDLAADPRQRQGGQIVVPVLEEPQIAHHEARLAVLLHHDQDLAHEPVGGGFAQARVDARDQVEPAHRVACLVA